MKPWILSLLGVMALSVGGAGCASLSTPAHHVVGDSQLNWLEINYLPAVGQPASQISLLGAGHIRIKRGNSPLVTDEFSQNVASPAWSNVDCDQANVPPEEMRRVFQALVDRGLLGEVNKEFMASAARGGPSARVCGQLDKERVVRFVVEPELLDIVRSLATYFDDAPGAAGKKDAR